MRFAEGLPMSATVSCPDAERLQRFFLGQLSEEEIAGLGSHIAECPQCLQTLDSLPQRDTLTEALAADTPTPPGMDAEAVRALIALVKTSAVPAGESRPMPARSTTGDFVGEREEDSALQFLSPP